MKNALNKTQKMERKIMTFAVIFLAVLLLMACNKATSIKKAGQWSKFAHKLNPDNKTVVIIAGRQMGKTLAKKIRRSGTFCAGIGYGFLFSPHSPHYKRDFFTFQIFIHSSYPLIVLFSPDQISISFPDQNISLEELPEEYHFLLVIGIEKVRKILDQGKCLIVSKWEEKEEVSIPGPESTPVYLVRGERYLTLIAAPNKKLLLDAIARFFSLDEIPLDPIIWKPK